MKTMKKKTIPLTEASTRVEYLGTHLRKEAKGSYSEKDNQRWKKRDNARAMKPRGTGTKTHTDQGKRNEEPIS